MDGSRILVNASFIHSKPTGLGVYTQEVLRSILSSDKAFMVAMPKGAPPELSKEINNLIPVPDFLAPGRGFFNNLARILWLQTVLQLRMKNKRVKLFYSTVPEGIIYPYRGLRQVITLHDLLPLIYEEEYPRIKYYFKYILPLLIKNSTRIICVSNNTKSDLLKKFPMDEDKFQVIYPGVDMSLFRILPNGETKQYSSMYGRYILYVGAMRRYKNLHRLIRAMGKVTSTDLKLLIVGQKAGKYYEELNSEVKRGHLEGKVYFLDYVDKEELVRLYNGALAFVFPSLYEGFGLPLLEAMACGCPVIASDRASIPEVCGDSAIYFNPEDVEDIARKIQLVLWDTTLRQKLKASALERVKTFSWENTARRTIDLLYSMLE